MTIAATATYFRYVRNGTTTQWSYPNKIFAASDLVVTDLDTSVPPVMTTLVLGVDYTVQNVDVDTGATVVTTVAGIAGHTIDIRSSVATTQSTSIKNQGEFLPELHEEAFDRLTRLVQDMMRRAYYFGIHGPDTEGTAWTQLPAAATRANAALIFDANGLPTVGIVSAQLISQTNVGFALYPQTAAEVAAAVIPTNYFINSDFLDPRRYGAVGDGVTDDTAALNRWVAVINASTRPTSVWPAYLTFICSPLNAITAPNFTWNVMSTIKAKASSWTAGAMQVQINGAGARIYGLKVDGNQANFAGAIAGYLLSMGAGNFLLDSVTLTNSCSEGLVVDTQSIGQVSNCHFDSNAYAGVDLRACSYINFVNCTINYNGYGFQKTFATNAFQAFGLVQRFRNHHCNYISCQFFQNGRDGGNCDQGTYGIKFSGCIAWCNGDGGFTITCDQQSTGRLGDGEPCYDLEYIDCESYDNWSSGLAAYTIASAACYNVTVDGGRYYNNNRLAGTQASASSYISGIYFGAGCTGIRVRTKAYDDRQLCPITAAAAGVLTATNWVAGGITNYPRVALYNASLVFQGYGNITAEAAGTVTITATVANSVTIGSIAAGWFVSQRVQHNGVFFDNNCQGSVAVDGFGFLSGALGPTLSGFKVVSGFTAGGQNIILPEATLDYTELMANATFDAGTSSGTAWNYSTPGTGGAANYYTTAGSNLRSPGCLQLIGGAGNNATAQATLIVSGLAYAQGCFVELSFWCSAVNAGDAQLILFFNGGTGQQYTVVNHPGGGYKQLRIGIYCPAGTTQLTPELQAGPGKTTYWDNGLLRVKQDSYDNRDYAPNSRYLPV